MENYEMLRLKLLCMKGFKLQLTLGSVQRNPLLKELNWRYVFKQSSSTLNINHEVTSKAGKKKFESNKI